MWMMDHGLNAVKGNNEISILRIRTMPQFNVPVVKNWKPFSCAINFDIRNSFLWPKMSNLPLFDREMSNWTEFHSYCMKLLLTKYHLYPGPLLTMELRMLSTHNFWNLCYLTPVIWVKFCNFLWRMLLYLLSLAG